MNTKIQHALRTSLQQIKAKFETHIADSGICYELDKHLAHNYPHDWTLQDNVDEAFHNHLHELKYDSSYHIWPIRLGMEHSVIHEGITYPTLPNGEPDHNAIDTLRCELIDKIIQRIDTEYPTQETTP